MRLWDTALDHGVNSTGAEIAILKLLSLTVFSDRRCLVDIVSTLSRKGLHSMCTLLNATPLSNHTPDNLAEMIINLSPEHFSKLQKTWYVSHISSSACISLFLIHLYLSRLCSVTCTYTICYHFCVVRVVSLSLTGHSY